MGTIRVTVEVEVDGDAQEMAALLAQRIAGDDDAVFFDDYGYNAWGGYDGPFVVAATVTGDDGRTLAHHAQRCKPCDCCGDFPQPEGTTTCADCKEGRDG
jgi:hypothetical protein